MRIGKKGAALQELELEDFLALSYPYELSREPDQGGFSVHHPDLEGCMSQGETAEEAITNLDEARHLWIEGRYEMGLEIPLPLEESLSGRVTLRLDPALHGQLVRIARRKGISLNLLLNTILAQHVGRMEGGLLDAYPPLPRVEADGWGTGVAQGPTQKYRGKVE